MAIEMPDLSGTDAWQAGPPVLGPGTHIVRIESAEPDKSTNGHDQIKVKLGNTDGSITDWITINSNTLGRVKQFLEACRYQVPQGAFMIEEHQLVGCSVQIYVKEEPRRDDPSKTRSTVASYEPAPGGVQGAPSGPSNDPLASPGAAQGNLSTDDIPF